MREGEIVRLESLHVGLEENRVERSGGHFCTRPVTLFNGDVMRFSAPLVTDSVMPEL